MTLTLTPATRKWLALGWLATALGFLYWASLQVAAVTTPTWLARAIIVDLSLTVPLIYFLLIRKTSIPNITVVPVTVLLSFVPQALLPADQLGWSTAVHTYFLPLLEVGLVGFVGYKVLQMRKAQRQQSGFDFLTSFRQTAAQVLEAPRVGEILATEVAVFRYGFGKATKTPGYTVHQHPQFNTLMVFIFLLVLVETTVVHILLHRWSATAAWVASGLSVYSGLWLWGHFRALRARPLHLTASTLWVRCGLLGDMEIPRDAIEKAELLAEYKEAPEGTRDVAPLGNLTPGRLLLTLSKPATWVGAYGVRKQVSTVRLHADDAEGLLAELTEAQATEPL